MGASATTTIRGVSIYSRQRTRKPDVFDIALSPDGITIQRPGRSDQRMGWERISQWEIEEGPGCVVLTLRGGGSVTPLLVKGWTLDDLETVMRETIEGTRGPSADAPEVSEVSEVATLATIQPGVPLSRAARRQAAQAAQAARRPRRRSVGKAFVTVVLLGVLAMAVVLVLLQSAGVISWGFLGPTA